MTSDDKAPDRFSLRRWSRRKLQAAREQAVEAPVAATGPAPVSTVPSAAGGAGAAVDPPVAAQPELPSVDSLTPESDFTAFMQPGIDAGVRRQALKKLFADPRFNVMDGLDVYIDDYTKPDPIPESVLERLAQSGFVRGLGAPRPEEPAAAPATPVNPNDAADGTSMASTPGTRAADQTAAADPSPDGIEQ